MPNTGVYPCYENQFQAGAAKDSAKSIADMTNFSVKFDGKVEEWTPFEQEGWLRRLKTGMGITISIEGKRNVGDEGNDYVAGKAFTNGRDAEGYFAWTFPDGTIVSWNDAIYNVSELGGGESTNVAPLKFDVMSNGKPTITKAAS